MHGDWLQISSTLMICTKPGQDLAPDCAGAERLRQRAELTTLRIMLKPHRFCVAAIMAALTGGTFMTGCASTPTSTPSSKTPSTPAEQQVAAMLNDVSAEQVKLDVESLAKFGTRHTLSETESDTRGIGAARRWLLKQFEDIALLSGRSGDRAMQVSFDEHQYGPDQRRVPVETNIVNVVAVLPGAMPTARHRKYYVIGHYDSRATEALDATSDAPGANDDASGVAVVLELARVMSQREYDATIVFMATAGEEQGLLGAKLHAQAARERGDRIRAVLSNDIVGDPTSPGGKVFDKQIRLFSEALPRTLSPKELAKIRALGMENDSPSRELARYIAETARRYGLPVQPMLVNRTDRFLRGGDHTSFNAEGFPAVRFTIVEENYDRQHQNVRVENGVTYGDLPEFVDPTYLANVTRINGAALACLANAPSEPENARIVTKDLGNDTVIRWEASPEPDVAGYEVVYRLTTEHEWSHVVGVGLQTEARLKISKDNYFFGIRAYDKDGYRSPATFCGEAPQ